MSTFFTSDTHFGSERTLELSCRPFKNIEEMDDTLIENWNKTVKYNDTVIHLGDFGDYEKIIKLNGKVSLVCGNYEIKDLKEKFGENKDEFKSYLKKLGFKNVYFGPSICKTSKLGDVWICHEPSKHKEGKFNLFGHIHNLYMVKKFGLNVGTDCHHFYPISEDQILFRKAGIEKFYDEEVFM